MDSCLIRVMGDEFDPATILDKLTMVPYSAFRMGETRTGRTPSKTGGMSFEIGKGPFEVQIDSAIKFLSRYNEELLRMSKIEAVENFFLELTSVCRLDTETAVQRDFLPAKLVRLAGDAGLSICISSWNPVNH